LATAKRTSPHWSTTSRWTISAGITSARGPRTDRRARLGQRGDVAAVDAVQEPGDAVTNTVGVQDRGVGIGGDREAVGHAQSRPRQFAMQLAQRGRLAADQRHVIQRDVTEPSDVAQGRGGHRASASSAT
jgi:hypothetical protein